MEFKKTEKKEYDFSRDAVKKAVLRSSVEHPAVVYPAAIGILGVLGVALLGGSALLLGVLIGGLGVAGLAWLSQYWLRRDYFSSLYVKRVLAAMKQQQTEKIGKLKISLEQLNANDARHQFERLEEKYTTLTQLVNQKFETGELIHARFLGIVEQVFLGAIDNLQKMAHLIKSNQSIDVNFIQQRLEKSRAGSDDSAIKREMATLQSRLDIYNDQLRKISTLMIDNEEAMTQIDLTMHAVTESEGANNQATLDLESAMNELQHLATRARKY